MARNYCNNFVVFGALFAVFFASSCDAIKCFDCNSANNSACFMNIANNAKMNAIIPVVDCARAIPNAISKQFFCRKITQTILYADKSPEIRITRGCGWVKHKRECYTADNKDHLETVCQCFGDMCNGASSIGLQGVATGVASILVLFQRGYL